MTHKTEIIDGILRYKKKPIMRWLSDHIDLNAMWMAYYEGEFTKKEFKQFYRNMGYSVSGFEEVWSDK